MSRRVLWFWGSLILTVTTIVLLVTGSSVLLFALDDENSIPLGTFITWAGMIALPLTIYWGSKDFREPQTSWTRFLAGALKFILLLAVLWVPISYGLAGNLSFTFTERVTFQGGQLAMRWFWRLSYGIAIGSVLILLAYWSSLIFLRGKAHDTHSK